MSTITDLSLDPAAALDAIGGAVERGASLLAGGNRAAGPATPQEDTGDLVPAPDAVGVAVVYERGFTAIVIVTPDLAEELSGQRDASALTGAIGPIADEIADALGVVAVSTTAIDSPAALDAHLAGVELVVASGIFADDAVVGTVAIAASASAGDAVGAADVSSSDAESSSQDGPSVDDPGVAASGTSPHGTAGAPGDAVPPRSATSAAAVAEAPPAPVISDAALTRGLSILAEVSLEVTAELGRAALRVSELLDLQPGSIIELDREAGAPVELFVNGTLFARAEVVVVDGQYAVRICELFGGGAQR